MIQKSEEVSYLVSEANSQGDVTSIKTYDFSTLYTNLPHIELKECIPKLVSGSFEGLDKRYISVDRNLRTHWTNTKRRSMLLFTPQEITKMFHFRSTMCTFRLAIMFSNSVLVSLWALIALPCSLTCYCMIRKAQLRSFSPGEV